VDREGLTLALASHDDVQPGALILGPSLQLQLHAGKRQRPVAVRVDLDGERHILRGHQFPPKLEPESLVDGLEGIGNGAERTVVGEVSHVSPYAYTVAADDMPAPKLIFSNLTQFLWCVSEQHMC